MATTVLTNAIEVSLAGLTDATWGNVTLPVPDGTKWAMVKHINTTSGVFSFGSRPVGSSDNAYQNMRGNSQCINFVKVDANKQINVRVQVVASGRLYLLGYSDADTFRTNHSIKAPSANGTWQLFDLTADKPTSFTAAGMFCRVHSGGYYSGLRADGSSDMHLFSFSSGYWVGAFSGVDVDEEVRLYGSTGAASSYRVTGLFDAAEWEFLTNWEQLSAAAGDTGKWYAVSTNRPGIRAALVFIENMAASAKGGCVRGAGSSDLHNTHSLMAASGGQFGIAPCDELGRIGVWKETDEVQFHLVGWLKGDVQKYGYDFACALDEAGLSKGQAARTDGAVGTDEAFLARMKTVSDAGIGADALSGVEVALGVAEAGLGAENIAEVLVGVLASDSGVGVEVFPGTQVTVPPIGDAGVGTDTAVAGISVTITDSGAGADSVPAASVFVSVPEAGAAVEAIAAAVTTLIQDAGAGAETPGVGVTVGLADSGAAVEVIIGGNLISLADAGTGADTIELLRQVLLQELGAASEAVIITASLTVSQLGAATESLSIQATFTLADAASGAEIVTTSVIAPISVADSGTGADAVASVVASLLASDAGVGVESVSINMTVLLADSGAGLDSVSFFNQLRIVEAALGLENVSVSVGGTQVFIQDGGVGLEAIGLVAALSILEQAFGADRITISRSGEGKVVVTFSLKKGGANFTLKQGGASFTLKKPGTDFTIQ